MKSVAAALGALSLALSASVCARDVLTLVEHADTDATTDLGVKGDSVGDILTFANPIYDAANKTKVGTDQGYCVRTVAGTAWECWWSLMVAGGQITVQGPFLDKGDSVLAITGGTGKYSTARGQMRLHPRNEKGTEYDFVYEIE
ncbi:MAG: dirigent protein [Steroidobacteraceae bacterium]